MPSHYEGENSQFGNKKLAAYSMYTANYTHYALNLLTLRTVPVTPGKSSQMDRPRVF